MVRRSRIQFRGPPAKKNKRIGRARADQFTKPTSLLSQQFASEQAWVESVLDSKVVTTANEPPFVGDEHEDSDQQSGAGMFTFPKITLPLNEEHEEQAENDAQAHASPMTTAPVSPPLSDSCFESPPESWVKLAPIYDRRRVPLIPEADPNDYPEFFGITHAKSQPKPEPESELDKPITSCNGGHPPRTAKCTPVPTSTPASASVLAPPTLSLLQKIVELFAGRKKRPKPIEPMARTEQKVHPVNSNYDALSEHSEPASTTEPQPVTEPEPEPEQHPEPPSAPRRAPPASFHQPLLTHAQVIPTVVKNNPCKLRRPSVHVSPAPTYADTGKVFSTEDLYRAGIVHRGFSAHRPPRERVATGHKRNSSAGQLLDRQGDVWANWYSKRQEVGSEPPRYTADSMIW